MADVWIVIHLSEAWREWKCPNFETVAKGIQTQALSIASPTFYRWAVTLHDSDGELQSGVL